MNPINHRIGNLIFFLIILLITGSCKKDKNENYRDIPNVYVSFYLQPDGIDFIPPNGWKIYDNQGYRGVLIYRIDQFTFNAFEMACPYDAEKETARVQVAPSGIILIDSTCMSAYNILDGMPAGGPSSIPLKQYFTEYVGGMLHVYNTP
jgi:hypothetical protein